MEMNDTYRAAALRNISLTMSSMANELTHLEYADISATIMPFIDFLYAESQFYQARIDNKISDIYALLDSRGR